MAERIATLEADKARLERIRDAAEELVECAILRGDHELPQPEDDPLLWTVRMQEAWDEITKAIDAEATK